MLHLLIGTDWTANRREILRRISEDVAHRRGGRILMVPELISHDTERRLCETVGDLASRYAEVLSFTRLARRVAEGLGSGAAECLDNGGRVVAMAAAAKGLHSQLKAYAAVETRPEFLTGLVDAVDEFKRCCISASDLKAASEQTEGSLAQKLEELSLLLEAYDALCAQGKRDPRDLETLLLEQLEEGSYGQEHVFYIDGFPDFTRQHLAILEHLIRVAPNVTISVTCDEPDSRKLAFEKAGQTAAQLIRCARRAGVEVHIEKIGPCKTQLTGMCSGLFQGPIGRDTVPAGALLTRQGNSIYHECVGAAEYVLELVRGGSRFREISIVCGNMAAYQNTLSMVFHRCCIPLYRSGSDDILSKSVIDAVLCAMDAALGGFERKDVLRYLRSVLSPVGTDLCDRMENYAVIWGINGRRWLMPWENHPEGLEGQWNDYSRHLLERMEQERAKAMVPLENLRRGFVDAVRLEDQVNALYGFFEEIGLAKRLDCLAREMEASGDDRSAQILNQLWDILLTALEQMHDILGNTHWDTESFTRLFILLLSQYSVGTIPPVLDAVMAGPVSAMRCQEPRHLIVLGAEEGSLPGYGGAAGVLTDQERVKLRSLGVPLTGGALDGLQAEFAEIYGVFCGARETVCVSYSGTQPSFLFRRLVHMSGSEDPWAGAYGPALVDPASAGAYLVRWEASEAAAELDLQEHYQRTMAQRNHRLGDITRGNVEKLYGTRMDLSASQIDRQGECRMSYFLKYGMRAKERKEATIDPAEFGTFVHAVLEETARDVMAMGGFHQISLKKTLEISRDKAAEYAKERFAQIDSKRLEYLFNRNGQELEMVIRELWLELKHAAFLPVDFETAFGTEDGLPAIDVSGKTMQAQLRGFVDRVDAWKEQGRNYFRVVDYKTGKKDFDYCDVFNGIGLQMLLYLFALEQEGEPVLGAQATPAGVQYFPARVPLLPSDGRLDDEEAQAQRQKEWKRRGLLLDDEDVLRAMEPVDGPKRLPVTWKKDGTFTGDLADREQLRQLRRFVFRTVGRMVDDIASGKVEPNPYTRGTSHNACTFCPYGAVCHKAQVEGRRYYKAMNAQRFWEELGKEVDRHG